MKIPFAAAVTRNLPKHEGRTAAGYARYAAVPLLQLCYHTASAKSVGPSRCRSLARGREEQLWGHNSFAIRSADEAAVYDAMSLLQCSSKPMW